MKDCFDAAEDVRSLINVPEVLGLLNGKIYTFKRPDGSSSSDIVIGVLSGDNFQIQTLLVNVRIYVPLINSDGKMVADQSKFAVISKAVFPLLDDHYGDSFWTEAEEESGLIRQPDGTYFQLIKVTYRSIQDNYKNI